MPYVKDLSVEFDRTGTKHFLESLMGNLIGNLTENRS
jgi:hypothetical protein